MKFLFSKKFKKWSLYVCAIIVIICAILKFIFHYGSVVDIVLYGTFALFFLTQAFEKVDNKKE